MPAPGDPPRARALAVILARESWIVAAGLIFLCLLAWWWLWGMAAPPDHSAGMVDMPGMPAMAGRPAPDVWSIAYLGPAALMWAVMMVAMMLPSAAPMILLHAALSRRSGAAGQGATPLFAAAYLALWGTFALAAAGAQALLIGSGLLSQVGLAIEDRRAAALLLVAIALYQLRPLKRLCLSNCRSPLGFLMARWGPTRSDALRMGLAHGAYCIGCCAVLMLLLFVGGVMNLAWIAFITLVVLAEKYLPARVRPDRAVAVLLLVGAVLLVAR